MGQAHSTTAADVAPPPTAPRVIHWRTTAPRPPTPPPLLPASPACPQDGGGARPVRSSPSSSPSSPAAAAAAAPPCGRSPASAHPGPPPPPPPPPSPSPQSGALADADAAAAAIPAPFFASASTPLADVLALLDKAAGDPGAPELRPFARLQVLDLHCNALPAVPAQLKLCAAGLCSLILHSNELTSLPDEVVGLSGLRTLDVHDNKIARLPERLADLRNLTYLDVSRNALARLPPDFDALAGRLDRLYLHGNPLDEEDGGGGGSAWRETVERAELAAFLARRAAPDPPPAVNFDAIPRAGGAPLASLSSRPSPRGKRAPPSKANLEARRAAGKPNAHGLQLDLAPDVSAGGDAREPGSAGTPAPARAASSGALAARPPEAPPAPPSSAAAGLAGIMKSGLAGSMPTLRRVPSSKSEPKENGDGPAADGAADGATTAAPPGQKKFADAKTLSSPASPGAAPKNAVTLPKLNPTAPGSAAPAEDTIPPWKKELMERKAKAAAAAAGNAAK